MNIINYCRMCRGPRPFNANGCTGCGTPRAKAIVPAERLKQPEVNPTCPGCGDNHVERFQAERWKCARCHSVFEPVEFGFVDDRPEINLAKKERLVRLTRKGRR